jgi:hypothetical protein
MILFGMMVLDGSLDSTLVGSSQQYYSYLTRVLYLVKYKGRREFLPEDMEHKASIKMSNINGQMTNDILMNQWQVDRSKLF